ncbi:hypothetical protein KFE25_011599 [Diacronema lutheri]|uniref:UBA domain-containing protein n=1 Tax=Diacronema lutheri TaxID=2081491 RepID=A0A8J5XD24_DIALT|nr:hypothetical protein KFE25_011599 [Diacronema lutheri]
MGQTSGRPVRAADATARATNDAAVRDLVQMGFDPTAAREALIASNGNVAVAAEYLLTNAEARARTHVPARPSEADARRERALLAAQARAVASRAAVPPMARRVAPAAARTPFAAASPATTTAAAGASGASREATIVRSAAALATMPQSLDLLIASLSKVAASPGEARYRRVPLGNANFRAHVVDAPGGLELLHAVGYEKRGDALVLSTADEAVLALALSALEAARGSSHYLDAKSEQLLVQALGASRDEWDQAERDRRAAAAAKVPVEPADGAAGNTLLCFHLGEKRDRSRCVWRRFESWSTLEEVCAYIESTTPFQIGRTAELLDITLSPPAKLQRSDGGRTLQVLGLWPSGHIQVQPIVASA